MFRITFPGTPGLIKSRVSERVVAGFASHNTLTHTTFD